MSFLRESYDVVSVRSFADTSEKSANHDRLAHWQVEIGGYLCQSGRGRGVWYYFGFMQTGIIGLGQVGKTTLFRILTKANVEGKASSQGTHVGVAKVRETRLVELTKLSNPKKITYATVQTVDLGGTEKQRNRVAMASLHD